MIAVTGMHRSGTSAITGLLAQYGLSLGTSHPVFNIPNPDNAKGHHENVHLILLHDEMLNIFDGGWDDLPQKEVLQNLAIGSENIIKSFCQNFDGDLVKDPRMSLFAAAWDRYCSSLEAFVFCFRNPLSVAHSLQKRDQMPLEKALHLWYEYNIRFIESGVNKPVILVHYDALTAEPWNWISHLLSALKLPPPGAEQKSRLMEFFDAGLNHHHGDSSTELPARVAKLYEVLTKAAKL